MSKRWPSTIGGTIYLAVVIGGCVGLILVATDHWRAGVCVLGASILVAALSRLVLGEFESGMLRVRGKIFDVIALSGIGALLITLAVVIPNQAPL